MGLFGDLYDFNGDGKLDALESATEFSAFMNLIDSEEEENEDGLCDRCAAAVKK